MSKEFRREFERITSRQVDHKTTSIALLHVVLPIAIAVLGVTTPYLISLNLAIPIVLWLFISIFYAMCWWKSHPTYNDVHRLLLQKQKDDLNIEELEKHLKNLKEITEDLYFKNIASFAYRAMSVEYIQNIKEGGLDREYFSELLNELLSPFYLRGDAVFGFSMSEAWSIGVYIFNKDTNVLRSVWRQKSNSHPSQGIGRDWISGEGHVGKAFLDRRPILTGNANDEAVAQLCRARNSKLLDYDKSAYISFASVPIAISENEDDDPYGVLVVTSDREDRFSEESTTELLMHAAETIAVIIKLSGADTGCLVNPNHDINEDSKGDKNVGSAEKK